MGTALASLASLACSRGSNGSSVVSSVFESRSAQCWITCGLQDGPSRGRLSACLFRFQRCGWQSSDISSFSLDLERVGFNFFFFEAGKSFEALVASREVSVVSSLSKVPVVRASAAVSSKVSPHSPSRLHEDLFFRRERLLRKNEQNHSYAKK